MKTLFASFLLILSFSLGQSQNPGSLKLTGQGFCAQPLSEFNVEILVKGQEAAFSFEKAPQYGNDQASCFQGKVLHRDDSSLTLYFDAGIQAYFSHRMERYGPIEPDPSQSDPFARPLPEFGLDSVRVVVPAQKQNWMSSFWLKNENSETSKLSAKACRITCDTFNCNFDFPFMPEGPEESISKRLEWAIQHPVSQTPLGIQVFTAGKCILYDFPAEGLRGRNEQNPEWATLELRLVDGKWVRNGGLFETRMQEIMLKEVK